MGIKDEIENELKNTHEDYAHSVVNAAVSSIPVLGSAASEIFNMVIVTPLEKRKEKWMLKIAESLDELQDKVDGFDVHKLCENELFISVLNRASQLALSNHQEEKIFALKNAVMNTALSIPIDENEEMMFLNLIDSITPWHIRFICFIENYHKKYESYDTQLTNGVVDPYEILFETYPKLKDNREFVTIIVKDLYKKDIFTDEHMILAADQKLILELTEYGKHFFSYIKEPKI